MKKLLILSISILSLSVFSCSPDPSEGEISQGHYLNRLDAEKEEAAESSGNIQNETETSLNESNGENMETTSDGSGGGSNTAP